MKSVLALTCLLWCATVQSQTCPVTGNMTFNGISVPFTGTATCVVGPQGPPGPPGPPGPAGGSGSSSSSSGGSSSSGSSSSGGSSIATLAGLRTYIGALAANKQVLVGQHSSYWDANPLDVVAPVSASTGKTPAILGAALLMGGASAAENTTLANNWLAGGGIVMETAFPANPFGGAYNSPPLSAANFESLYTLGTAGNTTWNATLDALAGQLKQINGPVIWRFLAELDGNWFWWGNQKPADFIKLWLYSYKRLSADGATNLLWMYNVNAYSGNYTAYYPGDAYVDIVSWDAYEFASQATAPAGQPWMSSDPTYAQLATLNKPIMLGEAGWFSNNSLTGTNTYDAGAQFAAFIQNFPQVVAINFWCQNAALSVQKNAAGVMNNPAAVTLANLP